MEKFDRKKHWENIYQTKALDEVGWYQPRPETSLALIATCGLPKTARIIDVGGGDSLLVDHLLELGYRDITVLDISENAIIRAKRRLGEQADKVKWIVADAAVFDPPEAYDLWHDRAAFHFLTEEKEIASYIAAAEKGVVPNGHLVIGTFSTAGPEKCSGIRIHQYSEDSLVKLLSNSFEKVHCRTVDHRTPSESIQNYLFCSFIKRPEEPGKDK
ncbi:trans-aconitate 2-methyltransferase [Robiginitalea sp. SC105]|uniref:class I SAM-dependent methyltransferase n=1 Tax=Robiginitalea sp. SC105 TaxID=2762332 RepID=UPI00163A84FE|nr:class I SAM-dependent methyltransferase [Robiginitalea sp. SC105]MBC2838574.1 class I SAM-dependent methyltransferase [Robiginitalea sp. SC105]